MDNPNQKLPNGQFFHIKELYAFIAKDKEGNEGIMGFRSSTGDWMPFIGADIQRVEHLKTFADRIAKQIGVPYEIRYFTIKDGGTWP